MPLELQELSSLSLGVRKRILGLLNGLNLPKTLTEAQVGTIQSVTPDDVGQFMRVGPYVVSGLRTQAYDWWVAESESSEPWRQIDSINIPYLQSAYASIASVALKAPLMSPVFTGTPSAPTVTAATATNQLATTAFVWSVVGENASIFAATIPPANTSLIWRDTNDNSINIWSGVAWVTDSAAAGTLSDYDKGVAAMAVIEAARPRGNATVRFATIRTTAGAVSVKTSTGHARLISPNGTLGVRLGNGVASISISISIPAGTGVRGYGVLAVNSAGAVSGAITLLHCSSYSMVALSTAGATLLENLQCAQNLLTYIDISGCGRIRALEAADNQFKSVDSIFLSIAAVSPAVGFVNGDINVSDGTSAPPTLASLAARNALTTLPLPRYSNIQTN